MVDGIWRTVGGRRIFIADGEDLASAMKNSGKFKTKKDEKKLTKEEQIKKLNENLEKAQGFLAKGKIKEEIRSLEAGFESVEEYRKSEEKRRNSAIEENVKKQTDKKEQIKEEIEEKRKKLEKEIEESPKEKVEQYEIIKENNPMLDDYHTGIRSPKDIKTFEETIEDEDSFSWGDFSKKDAEIALKKGEITIYSSYPIKQGTFVSSSKIQAEEYAGGKGKKIYSKKIPLNDVAWINGDEGQFASLKK